MYIIKYADRLNDTSANKILKFLEEPEEKIVGFFITDNIQGIIPTIKSRCEIYNVKYNVKNIVDLLNITESQMKFYDIADNLTARLNGEPKFKLMADVKNISKYERGELDVILKIIRKMYIIKYMYIIGDEYNDIDFVDRIINSIETNEISVLLKRIKLLDSVIEYNNLNVNKDLVMNKLFLEWV